MSSRVTRSSARLAAAETALVPALTAASTPITNPTPIQRRSRKRKATTYRDSSPEDTSTTTKALSPRRSKRRKLVVQEPSPPPPEPRLRPRGFKSAVAMVNPGPSIGPSGNNDNALTPAQDSSRRKSSRNKKPVQDPEPSVPTTSTNRRTRKTAAKKPQDPATKGPDASQKTESRRFDPERRSGDQSDDENIGGRRRYEEEDDDGDDPFRGSFIGRGGSSHGISSTLRALSGMISGVSTRLREILGNLRQKDDPSVQLIALQELSEILLVSTEDNLTGHFSPDQFVKELVTLMQPSDTGEENPEMMLLACRCIANLMEALPPSTANIVYGGAVPILCQKLLEIHFIDLAEQALSTLEKISIEFPSSIVREGGLTACLTYLDFFATSTQRTAVTTAANCCRNISQDSFPVIRDIMPILLNVLGSSDQKVVEQGSLCVSRVVESFKYHQDKLEELISTNLLKAILRLLLPGTTNLIGPGIHTQFLSVLAITARASPSLSAELFKMNIVDTIYQILTGVSPPGGVENVATQIDSVLIMQALIHRPREQVYETLNVICELLPGVNSDELSLRDDFLDGTLTGDNLFLRAASKLSASPNSKRIELLNGCKEELKRFAIVLLPTLTDAYASTVNLSVRQKVLTAQLKMLSNLDTSILEDALRPVPYASYLASILSQRDHPTLVVSALQAAELLLVRLEPIYRYQFYREGVMAEIAKLADEPPKNGETKANPVEVRSVLDSSKPMDILLAKAVPTGSTAKASGDEPSEDENDHDEDDEDEDEDDEDDEPHDVNEDMSPSPSDSSSSDPNFTAQSMGTNLHDYITSYAKKILEVHESTKGTHMRDKATAIMKELQNLAKHIEGCYIGRSDDEGVDLFRRLSSHFHGESMENITSFELFHSEVVQVLLDVLSNQNDLLKAKARKEFIEVFMDSQAKSTFRSQGIKASSTPFSVLVHKLQDLLSRAEHFEVVTVRHNALDSNRNNGNSSISKQIRLRLFTDDDEVEIPRAFRNIIVSLHGVSTFRALDEYLRPRMCLPERPRGAKHREGVTNALAAFAAAASLPNSSQRNGEQGDTKTTGTPALPTPQNGSTTVRGTRRVSQNKGTTAFADSTPAKEKLNVRRSSRRRHQAVAQSSSENVAQSPEQLQSPLECADEKQLADEDDLEDSNTLDAIVDDLEEGLEAANLPDPTAVNLEVAPTGKVTARKDDGSRVSTPSQTLASLSSSLSSSRARELIAAGFNPAMAHRSMTYAAALQAIPQDWHLEFRINDEPLPGDFTIYQALRLDKSQSSELSSRNIWTAAHPIKIKRVPGPAPPSPSSLNLSGSSGEGTLGMPSSLLEHPETSNILRLLDILHELNANVDDVLDDGQERMKLVTEPVAQFVNTKLTAKLNRQLEEPLIVASKCLPNWSQDLGRLYPFLFPFETRHLFLQLTSFGYSRCVSRWQSGQSAEETRRMRHHEDRPFVNKVTRQKVRIARTRFLESALKVMELYGHAESILEIEYFEEVGTGLGPTLEFYSTVSKEFSKRELNLWRAHDSNLDEEYVFSKSGLFPKPMSAEQSESPSGAKVLYLFKMLGKFIARSMYDSRIIDVSLNPTFFRISDDAKTTPLSLAAVKTVDSQLANSLKLLKQFANLKKAIDGNMCLSAAQKARAIAQLEINGVKVENLSLDFTLPGNPSIELIKNGSNISVTIDNVAAYVESVVDMTLGSGIRRQIDAFKAGFSQVLPYSALKSFTPNELVMLFGRVEEDWSLETLLDSIKADHGFNMDSKSVRNLLQTMSELSVSQRRNFLQFVTGSPKLPIGGFKNLTPMFTVVCKPSEPPYTSDDFLISVMTCANYVKLPDYTNIEVLRKRLLTAIEEGQGAFHLS